MSLYDLLPSSFQQQQQHSHHASQPTPSTLTSDSNTIITPNRNHLKRLSLAPASLYPNDSQSRSSSRIQVDENGSKTPKAVSRRERRRSTDGVDKARSSGGSSSSSSSSISDVDIPEEPDLNLEGYLSTDRIQLNPMSQSTPLPSTPRLLESLIKDERYKPRSPMNMGRQRRRPVSMMGVEGLSVMAGRSLDLAVGEEGLEVGDVSNGEEKKKERGVQMEIKEEDEDEINRQLSSLGLPTNSTKSPLLDEPDLLSTPKRKSAPPTRTTTTAHILDFNEFHTPTTSSSSSATPIRKSKSETGSHPLTLVERYGDLLRAIAQKEARVEEIRRELEKEEKELGLLKSRWSKVVSRASHQFLVPSASGSSSTSTQRTNKPKISEANRDTLSENTLTESRKHHHSSRPQPANAARLLPSPSRRPNDNPHPLTRTSSSASTSSTTSSSSTSTQLSTLQQTASNTAASLMSSIGLSSTTIGMADLTTFQNLNLAAAGTTGGKVVEGGKRFVGHMWDALQGVAEGVGGSGGGSAAGAGAGSNGMVMGKGGSVTVATGTYANGLGGGGGGEGGVGGVKEEGIKEGGLIPRTPLAKKKSGQLRSMMRNRTISQDSLGTPSYPRQSMPLMNSISTAPATSTFNIGSSQPTNPSIRNIKNLSLVSSTREKLIDDALTDNLVEAGSGEMLEGLGFVPLSPKKMSPRRGGGEGGGEGDRSPSKIRGMGSTMGDGDGDGIEVDNGVARGGMFGSAMSPEAWSKKLGEVMASPSATAASKRMSGMLSVNLSDTFNFISSAIPITTGRKAEEEAEGESPIFHDTGTPP